MPNDPQGRPLYELLQPFEVNITVTRYVDAGLGAGETVTEETLDWWLILIICLIAAFLLAVVAFWGYRYYVNYKIEKEQRQKAEEELAYEEDGIDGFYARAGVNHAQENPLHNKQIASSKANVLADAQMMIVEDGEKFEMDMKKENFGQRMFETDEFGKRTTKPIQQNNEIPNNNLSPINVAGRGDQGISFSAQSGEYSPPSTYNIEEGSLPQSFNKSRSGSIKYTL